MSFAKRLSTVLSESVVTEAIHLKDTIKLLQRSNAQTGVYGSLSRVPGGRLADQPPEVLQQIVDAVVALFNPAVRKFVPYVIQQIAVGKLSLWTIQTDVPRVEATIAAFLKIAKTKEWKGSKDIYSYKDWRELEKVLIDVGAFNTEFGGDKEEHSEVLFTKTYQNKNALLAARLAGISMDQVPSTTFWLRKLLTVYGCTKYGKGTQWCTSGDRYSVQCNTCKEYSNVMVDRDHPKVAEQGGWLKNIDGWKIICPKCQSPDVEASHATDNYLKDGLYIIEKADERPRRPVLQVSKFEIKGVEDRELSRAGNFLSRFITDALAAVGNKMQPDVANTLNNIV